MSQWLTILVCGPLLGFGEPEQKKAPFATIAEAVRGLGDDSFAVREKAMAFLWQQGRAAEKHLTEAVKNPDPEVSRRADRILEKFRWGIFPDTPPAILQLISQFRQARPEDKLALLERVTALGPSAIRAASRLVSQESEPRLRSHLEASLRTAVLNGMPALLTKEDPDLLENVLEIAFTDTRDLAACLILGGRTDAAIPIYRARAENNGGEQSARLLTYLYRAKDDLKNLRWAAEKSGDQYLRQAILAEVGAWAELADLKARLKEDAGEDGVHAMIQRLAGRTADFEKTMTTIYRRARKLKEGHEDVWWDLKPVLFNGWIKEGLELLVHGHRHDMAFEVLTAQTRYKDALQLPDPPGGRNGSLDAYRAKTLIELGEPEQARKLLERAGAAWKISPGKHHWSYCMQANVEFLLGMEDIALKHGLDLLRAYPKTDAYHIAGSLYYSQFSEASEWWEILRTNNTEDLEESLQRLHRLLKRRLSRRELEKLVRVGQEIQRKDPRNHGQSTLAETCLAYKLPDLACECLEKRTDWEDKALPWYELGKFHFKRKEWARAAACFQTAADKEPPQAAAVFLRGWALTQLGQKPEGHRLMHLASWLPLGNHEQRYLLANAQEELGFEAEGARQYALLRLLGSDDDYYSRCGTTRAARLQKDLVHAADMFERGYHCVMRRNSAFSETSAWVRIPFRARFYRAQGLLAAGRLDAAWKEIQVCLSILPGSLEVPRILVPALEKRGEKQKAELLFQRVFDHYGDLCRHFPRCGDFHNKRARLTLSCRRPLDLALDHARTAVKLSPKKADFKETLAEVHFQRGEKDLALKVIQDCLVLEPDNAYFRQQEKRIRQGDPSAPLPEM